MYLLVIEDDELDVIALQRAFKKKNVPFEMTIAENGDAALRLLQSDFYGTIHSLVILLDINMPKMNGLEFLRELRREEFLKRIPVFILTTSDELRDISAGYALGISGYLLKQNIGSDFEKLISLLEAYAAVNIFPDHHSG